jgi:hypothetical protein
MFVVADGASAKAIQPDLASLDGSHLRASAVAVVDFFTSKLRASRRLAKIAWRCDDYP